MFLVSSCSCFCAIHWSQVLSWEWRCSWSSACRSNYIWVINNCIVYLGVAYIRGLTLSCVPVLHICKLSPSLWYFHMACKNGAKWVPQNPIEEKSTLVQVMALCRQATSHYLSQCRLRSATPYMASLGHNLPIFITGIPAPGKTIFTLKQALHVAHHSPAHLQIITEPPWWPEWPALVPAACLHSLPSHYVTILQWI